jgi:ribosomal protein L24
MKAKKLAKIARKIANKQKFQKPMFQVIVDGVNKKKRDEIAAAIQESGVFDKAEFIVTAANVQINRIA